MGTDRAFTLREIVSRLGGEALGEVAEPVTGVATLDSAGPRDIAFLANPKYRSRLSETRAGAVILGHADREAASIPCIVSDNPYVYYARTVALFHPPPPVEPGIHPFAQVDGSANVAASAQVAAFAVIGPGCTVGEAARIGEGAFLGAGVHVGDGARLYPRVTIHDGCRIGARSIVHSGVVIGADGFGMAPDAGRWVKIPQIGGVRIGDDVEIGANTCIDRGALDDTVIGDGVKLDNQIQVGHNCVIGEHTVIAGCTGISGSVTIGRHCMIGGGVGIVGHITIADNVILSGFTFVTKSITEPGTYTSGMPVMAHADWLRNASLLRQLHKRLGRPQGAPKGEKHDPDDDD